MLQLLSILLLGYPAVSFHRYILAIFHILWWFVCVLVEKLDCDLLSTAEFYAVLQNFGIHCGTQWYHRINGVPWNCCSS